MSKSKFIPTSTKLGLGESFQKVNQGGRRVVYDELLIRSEIYNGNDFDIVFYRILEKDTYVKLSGITLGPLEVICKSKEFCILNTSFYIPRAFDRGKPGKWEHEIKDCVINVIRNYGNQIGKGNRKPSAPVIER